MQPSEGRRSQVRRTRTAIGIQIDFRLKSVAIRVILPPIRSSREQFRRLSVHTQPPPCERLASDGQHRKLLMG